MIAHFGVRRGESVANADHGHEQVYWRFCNSVMIHIMITLSFQCISTQTPLCPLSFFFFSRALFLLFPQFSLFIFPRAHVGQICTYRAALLSRLRKMQNAQPSYCKNQRHTFLTRAPDSGDVGARYYKVQREADISMLGCLIWSQRYPIPAYSMYLWEPPLLHSNRSLLSQFADSDSVRFH
jgi:hypothetical protein